MRIRPTALTLLALLLCAAAPAVAGESAPRPGARVLLRAGWLCCALERCEEAMSLLERVDISALPPGERDRAATGVRQRLAECIGPPNDMVYVPAGAFRMGSTRGERDERPVRRVVLAPYYIDRTEVTTAAFRRCVEWGACPATTWRSVDDDPRCSLGARTGEAPVSCVSWSGARAYCEWLGKRLPTEAEWEKAARGSDGRTFPWGEEPPDCRRAVMRDARGAGCGADHPANVGSRPAGVSEYGVFDLAGNLREWVNDWYAADAYARDGSRHPGGPTHGALRCLRGGGFLTNAASHGLRATSRAAAPPDHLAADVGFRCAASVPYVPLNLARP